MRVLKLHEKKILSLRDLAISHLPRVQENRAVSSRLYGRAFIDSASINATQLTNLYAESTTVEKLAAELLDLTYMHPDTQAQYPFELNLTEDAERIEQDKLAIEKSIELQPQIEAAILETARLLCELTGSLLPPWMDEAAAPANAAKLDADKETSDAEPKQSEQQGDEPLTMKRVALIALLENEGFKEVEKVFKSAAENGLSVAAKHNEFGYWYVKKVRTFFTQKRARQVTPATPDLNSATVETNSWANTGTIIHRCK
jgi:hypothetical protein